MNFMPFPVPITTADAEAVEIHYIDGDLEVRFVDWRQSNFQLRFLDSVRFRWDPLGGKYAPRDDEAYEVIESGWLEELRAAHVISRDSRHRHFKLCFNASSVLDVVATSVTLVPPGG